MFWTGSEIGVRIVVISHCRKYVCCRMLLLLLEFVITVKPVLNVTCA